MKRLALFVTAGALFGCALGCGSDDSGTSADSAGPSSGGSGGISGGSGGISNQAGAAGHGEDGPELEAHSYAADDARIRYTGRIDFGVPDTPRFSLPGSYITVRFKGTGISVHLRDQFKYGTERSFYDAAIDGDRVAIIAPDRSTTDYEIQEDLPYGEHTLVLTKRTQASLGYGIFSGVTVTGELLEPAAEPTRRMIFIGDSISAGEGSEAANDSAECGEDAYYEAGGWGQPYQNANAAFGPVLARSFDAAYHLVAASGIGLVRNYTSEYDTRPMPEVYDLLFIESETSPAWDHGLFDADVIVVGLGTNDFSPGDDDRDPALDLDAYSAAYIDFVDTLLGYHPAAHVFAMTSHMLGDGWPSASDMSATSLNTAIDMVVEHYESEGIDQVHKLAVRKVTGQGCGTHMTAEQQAVMAQEMRPSIAEVMGW